MAFILNIESSTGVCSVALSENGNLTDFIETAEGNSHSRLLGSYVSEVMRRNGAALNSLAAVAVSGGPGSYTGLRIGVSMAKGICYANNIPLIAVSPLQGMSAHVAANLVELVPGKAGAVLLCPMIDARRMEVYTALFNTNNEFVEDVKAMVLDENSFSELLDEGPVVFFGDGSDKLREVQSHPNALFVQDIKTSARFMCLLSHKALKESRFESTAYFEPFYLKDFIAGVSKRKVL